jgi:hypothetical protein
MCDWKLESEFGGEALNTLGFDKTLMFYDVCKRSGSTNH